MENNLANRFISSFECSVLRKFGAVEAGNTSIFASRPEKLLAVIKGKGSDRSRDTMHPRWGQRQPIDLYKQLSQPKFPQM